MFNRFVLFPVKCSLNGLRFLCKERAFLVEIAIGFIVFPMLFYWLGINIKLLAVIVSYFAILVTEALNTAVESVVNFVSPEYNFLAKKAKDMGSAAVFLAVVNALVVLLLSMAAK
ncbi:MAG: diacylglycerol kinase [Puniceicoccales bacterium]|jgi:diacylglycerol kinase (ATP)|nr:diacylglycerol kinase [Puniceicoccales bacterium]